MCVVDVDDDVMIKHYSKQVLSTLMPNTVSACYGTPLVD